jgi:arylsulfatase A-like enzyme
MSTIMTGLPHRSHRAGIWDGTFYGLDPALPLVHEYFGREGYQTAAFFNVVFMSEDFGFQRGFDHFDCESSVEEITARNARETVDDVLEYLGNHRDPDRPLYLAVHFYDPHLTYDPEPPFDTLFADSSYDGPFDTDWGSKGDVADVNSGEVSIDSVDLVHLVDLYDGEIAFIDHELGRLFSELRRSGKARNTLIVLMADHGEEFLDHGGMGHGHTLFQELLDIPLIVSGPGIDSGRVDSSLVGQIDILPALLCYGGMEAPEGAEGESILRPVDPDRILPSSLVMTTGGRVCVRRSDQKLHWIQSSDASFQFDLRADPEERRALETADSSLVRAAQWYWATPAAGHPRPVSMDRSMVRALRDLGYIR